MSLLDKIKDAANDAGIKIPEVNSSSITGKNGQNSNSTNGINNSTSGLYDPQLEKLIELAIADGQITEQERQVLFKKAEFFGIDADEFEMVLQAKLFEHNKATTPSAPMIGNVPPPPASSKYGEMKKCPACGAIIQAYTTKCPDCGFEFSHIEANHSIQTLFKMLSDVDQSAKWYSNSTAKKITIIGNFPIPTTKEDILEFLSMAVPQSKFTFRDRLRHGTSNSKEERLAKAWRAKSEQVIMKAKFSINDDKYTLAEIANYAKELKIKF